MGSNIVLLGAPGSGKGTQAKNLTQKKGFNHISTGDLLRSEIDKKSELGLKVKSVMDSGELVTDDLVFDLLKANIDLKANRYIFDGFPRTLKQAEMLNDMLGEGNYKVLFFDVDLELLVTRISNRRVSSDGNYIYNLISSPPKSQGVCDVTGLQLIQREDDKEDVVRKRMSVYKSEIDPVLEYYKAKNLLSKVDAEKSIDEVTSFIFDLV
jgi:adenylate kinase